MAKRKIKDAKDLTTNELIYFRGHAKATFISDGRTVEDAIINIEEGNGVDLSDYATKEELNDKQDTLVSGANIKTINGESILGEGDINISSGTPDANVQAVDTSETLEDVTADYATRAYVDGLVGDINSVLESIINGGASIITFYINQTFIETTIECQAEDGMTWEEWCNSSYNTFGYYIEGTSIMNDDGVIIVLDGIDVSNTDIIQSGVTYNWG